MKQDKGLSDDDKPRRIRPTTFFNRGLECVCDRGSFRKRSQKRFDCERSHQGKSFALRRSAHVEPDWVAPSDAVGKAFRGSAMEAPVDALPQPG